jgi:hypothetical protein
MLRYLHFLVELYVHETARFNHRDVCLGPLLLLSDVVLLLSQSEVESDVWRAFANKLDQHRVT